MKASICIHRNILRFSNSDLRDTDGSSNKVSLLHHDLCRDIQTAPDKPVPDQSGPSLMDQSPHQKNCWDDADQQTILADEKCKYIFYFQEKN